MSLLEQLAKMSKQETPTVTNNPLLNKNVNNPLLNRLKIKKVQETKDETSEVKEEVTPVIEDTNKENGITSNNNDSDKNTDKVEQLEENETLKDNKEEYNENITTSDEEPDFIKEVKEFVEDSAKEETSDKENAESKEAVVENPPKKRRRRRATNKTEETSEEVNTVSGNGGSLHAYEYGNLDIFGMKISFEEANTIVLSKFVDDKWIEFRDAVNKKIEAIKINRDINPSVITILLEELNTLNDEIAAPLEDAKCLINILSDKEAGVGTVIKTIASAKDGGTNTTSRQAAGFEALMNAEIGGEKLNLVLMLMAAKVRYSFLESIKNRIEFKYNTLITVSGALKIDAGLSK